MRNPFRTRLGEGPIPPPPPRPADQIGPLIEAMTDPLIVLDGYHISHANTAARTLLGQHIVGDYVRLALRHPAAGAVIAGDEDGPITLSGLGGHDRLWELSGGDIRPGCRLLRLIDDLLSLSRIEADRYARPREAVDLASIVAIACHELNDDRIALDLPGAS